MLSSSKKIFLNKIQNVNIGSLAIFILNNGTGIAHQSLYRSPSYSCILVFKQDWGFWEKNFLFIFPLLKSDILNFHSTQKINILQGTIQVLFMHSFFFLLHFSIWSYVKIKLCPVVAVILDFWSTQKNKHFVKDLTFTFQKNLGSNG